MITLAGMFAGGVVGFFAGFVYGLRDGGDFSIAPLIDSGFGTVIGMASGAVLATILS